jgi:hypothetical protein
VKQKFVQRTVVGGIVQIDGQNFKPTKPVKNGRELRFMVFFGDDGVVRSPVYSYMGNSNFLRWKEDKRKVCGLGATET